MREVCLNCGGEIKEATCGYQCIFCGATYATLEELAPRPKARRQGNSQAKEVPVSAKASAGVDVFADNVNSVLEITWQSGSGTHSGSGFLITKDGYAITNTHVVTQENGASVGQVNVLVAGENVTADVIAIGDDRHGEGSGIDLAIIKLSRVPAKATTVSFENFDNVKIGEKVFVIGNSLGYGTCITAGIVSDRLRNVNGHMLMMTDCAVNGGNSGGPVFNEMGLVIAAVVSGITGAEGMNFAIPSNDIVNFIIASQYQPLYKRFTKYSKERRPSLAPCPRCGSWNCDVENNIFYCYDCEYEGG